MRTEAYSRDQLERIFARATELQVDALPAVPSRDAYSLAELKAIAAEAGIDPALIERAAREIAVAEESTTTGVVSRHVEVSFPGTLSEARARRVLAAVRSSLRQQGTGEVSPSGFSWMSDGRTLLMTAYDEDGETRLRVSSNAWPGVSIGGLLGLVAAWITAGVLEPLTMGVFFGSIAAGLGITTALGAAAVAKARRQAASVLAAASRTMMDPDSGSGRTLLEDAGGSADPGSTEPTDR